MLGWRLSLGTLIVASLVGLFVWDSRLGPLAPCLWVLCLLLGLRSAWELVWLFSTRSFEPRFPLLAVCCAAIVSANWVPQLKICDSIPTSGIGLIALPFIAFVLSVLAVFVAAAVRYREPGKTVETLGAEVLILAYVGVLCSFTAQLRWVAGETLGYLPFVSLLMATKCGDTAAYTCGRLWGKKKLVPRLSPGKTWAGFWGAIGGATAGSLAWFHWGTPAFSHGQLVANLGWVAIYGALLGVIGLVGDLCESLLKRDVGQKDSAPLLPGFGGILDLLDSILFTGPAAYVLWLLLPLTHTAP